MKNVAEIACVGILVEDTFCGPMKGLPPEGSLLGIDAMPVKVGGCAANVAIDLAKQCLHVLAEPIEVEGHPIFLSASVGIAISPDHGIASGQLLAAADAAMYSAKQGVQGGIAIASRERAGGAPRAWNKVASNLRGLVS